MEINYWWVSIFIVLMAVLIIWLIRRNRKDEKTFEEELFRQEVREEDKTTMKSRRITSEPVQIAWSNN